MTHAAKTSVPAARSRAQVEDLLRNAGASSVSTTFDLVANRAGVLFALGDRSVLLLMPLRPVSDFLRVKVRGRDRVQSPSQMHAHHEQHLRERWRHLRLCLQAKLVAIEAGIETFDEAFLAYVVVDTPSGPRPFGQVALPEMQTRAVTRLALPAAGGGA